MDSRLVKSCFSEVECHVLWFIRYRPMPKWVQFLFAMRMMHTISGRFLGSTMVQIMMQTCPLSTDFSDEHDLMLSQAFRLHSFLEFSMTTILRFKSEKQSLEKLFVHTRAMHLSDQVPVGPEG